MMMTMSMVLGDAVVLYGSHCIGRVVDAVFQAGNMLRIEVELERPARAMALEWTERIHCLVFRHATTASGLRVVVIQARPLPSLMHAVCDHILPWAKQQRLRKALLKGRVTMTVRDVPVVGMGVTMTPKAMVLTMPRSVGHLEDGWVYSIAYDAPSNRWTIDVVF
jgi:hypothetical protein